MLAKIKIILHFEWFLDIDMMWEAETHIFRDLFVHAPSQWETTLQCNVVSHWLGSFTKWTLHIIWNKTIFIQENVLWTAISEMLANLKCWPIGSRTNDYVKTRSHFDCIIHLAPSGAGRTAPSFPGHYPLNYIPKFTGHVTTNFMLVLKSIHVSKSGTMCLQIQCQAIN